LAQARRGCDTFRCFEFALMNWFSQSKDFGTTERGHFLTAGLHRLAKSTALCSAGGQLALGGSSVRCQLSSVMAKENSAVESRMNEIDAHLREARTNSKTRRKLSPQKTVKLVSVEEQPVVMDAQTFKETIDNLEKDLRNMLSDNPTYQPKKQQTNEKEEAEDEDELRKERIMQYRYVRKIASPVPKLEDYVSDAPPAVKKPCDKIERNMHASATAWLRKKPERVEKFNQQKAQRSMDAQQRRQEADVALRHRALQRMEEVDARVLAANATSPRSPQASPRQSSPGHGASASPTAVQASEDT